MSALELIPSANVSEVPYRSSRGHDSQGSIAQIIIGEDDPIRNHTVRSYRTVDMLAMHYPLCEHSEYIRIKKKRNIAISSLFSAVFNVAETKWGNVTE